MNNINRSVKEKGFFSLDGNNNFPRISALLKAYWDSTPKVDIERAKIYTDSYRETEGEDVLIRRAKAFKMYCDIREISIPEGQLIVGDTSKYPRGGVVDPIFHGGWLKKEVKTISTRKQDPYEISEADIECLEKEIFPYWEGKSISEH